MTRKVAVCDDEWATSQQIASYLEAFQQSSSDQFQVFYFSSGEELMENMPHDTQILFLDIQMPGITGIDAARKLRSLGNDLLIFFVSGNTSFALEGYDVHAYSFLRKPLQYTAFKRNLEDALRQLNKNAMAVLKIPKGGSMDIIRCGDIIYAEVYKHQVMLTTRTRAEEYTISLGEIEKQIGKYGFFRCHKSYLINMKRVKNIRTADIEMSNGDLVPLSKHRRQQFLSAYASFLGGRP